jgi:Kef-type K+ transport system membrane component KefB
MSAFLLAVGLIFAAAAVCGSIAARLRLPRVVGEMAAGLILGQSLLRHVWPSAESYLFSAGVLDALKAIGLLVVLLYVALVGAELDRGALRGQSRRLVGATAIGLVAAIGGAAVVGSTLSDLEPAGVPRWTYYAFLTGALLVTAVPVLARILDETGLARTRVGSVTITLSIADDFVAFSIVAIAIAVATDGRLTLALAGTAILAALALVWKANVHIHLPFRDVKAISAVGIGILALVAGATGVLGASTLVAAFLVGAIVWRLLSPTGVVPGGDVIRVLVPLYIVYAGLSVDVSRLAHSRLAFGILLVTLIAIGTKAIACLVAGPLLSLDRSETVSLAVLRNTRGLTELVALNLGYQAGILSQDLYSVFFAMALLTTAASGAIATAALRPLGTPKGTALEPRVGVSVR